MTKFIVTPAPLAVTDKLKQSLQELQEHFKGYFANLSETEKKGRTMAEGREGLARLVSHIATEHALNLSRNDDPSELAAALEYDAALEGARQACLTLLEQISETQMANSIDIMTMVDRYTQTLDAARSSNTALDLALREVDEWNKRFGQRNDRKNNEAVTGDPTES